LIFSLILRGCLRGRMAGHS